MYIRNNVNREIGPISFKGYSFTILPGVSAVWDDFGKWVINHYKPTSTEPDPTKRGSSILAVSEAKRYQWKGQYVEVTRYKIESRYIPDRDDLIRLAEERGVPRERVLKFQADAKIENDEIVAAINELPIPEDIKYPEQPPGKGEEPEPVPDETASIETNP